jgi:hypothetical protein
VNTPACLILTILASVLAPRLGSQTVTVGTLPAEILESPLQSAPADNRGRQESIRTLFSNAGCEPAYLEERKLKHSKRSNVICTLPAQVSGASVPGEIVVGAHFDHVQAGAGIIDNWSGAALLPGLFESLKIQPRQHTFIFISFAEEETGLNGSRDYANSLSEDERASVRAMVNIDSVAAGTTAVWVSRADKELVRAAAAVAGSLNIPLERVDVDRVGDSDSASFKALRIPVIDFHSLHSDSLHIIHTRNDNLSAVKLAAYAETFRVISTFLGFIDQKLPQRDFR